MKRFVMISCLALSMLGQASAGDPLEYQVAVIEAGKYVAPTDSSVARAKALLLEVSKIYGISQTQAADIAAKIKSIVQKDGVNLSMLELFDWALIACEAKCTLDQYRDYLSLYASTRLSGAQTHHQAVHGLLILEFVAKTTMKGKKK